MSIASNTRFWWFDGDYSECYYAWSHVDKRQFAAWVQSEEDSYGEPVRARDVEHVWAIDGDDGRFKIVKRMWGLFVPSEAKPITRYQP